MSKSPDFNISGFVQSYTIPLISPCMPLLIPGSKLTVLLGLLFRHESRRIAELLGQLPTEVDVERLINQALLLSNIKTKKSGDGSLRRKNTSDFDEEGGNASTG